VNLRIEIGLPLEVGLDYFRRLSCARRPAFGLRLRERTAFLRKRIRREATSAAAPTNNKVPGSEAELPICMLGTGACSVPRERLNKLSECNALQDLVAKDEHYREYRWLNSALFFLSAAS
jgi:hypothetical protein